MFALNLSSAADPPTQVPAVKLAADFSDPKATNRSYIDAVRRNDLEAAKQCWVIDDDNKSGALDTIVGLWVVPRRFFQVAEKTYKAEDLPADFKKRQRDDITDAALDLTRERLADAEVKITGDTAELKIKWQKDDGYPNPAFEYRDGPTSFRKVATGRSTPTKWPTSNAVPTSSKKEPGASPSATR